jgi:hypothetical protein
MVKLIVCIMGDSCGRTMDMCIKSVLEADKIVFCWGMKDQLTQIKLNEWKEKLGDKLEIISNKFDQEDKQMNGKQRNYYLEHLKKNYKDNYVLCLDSDEVVEDISKIKDFINKEPHGIYSVKMRHFIGDLGHEDSVNKKHFVLNRLFYINYAKEYPLGEHPVLKAREGVNVISGTECTTIWHLAYVQNMWEIKKRYENHLNKSEIHTPGFLKQWYYAHLFGQYPRTPVNPIEIPQIILDEFGVDKDEFYFEKRGLETKHFIDAYHWKEFFKCNDAIEFGCGKGPRILAMNLLGIDATGVEISEYAVRHRFHENVNEYDVTNPMSIKADLVIAYDLLEHIKYEDLDKVINNLKNSAKKYILISVPVIGDPNLENDPTHIIKEDRDWWMQQFLKKGLIYVEVPNHFLFKDQLMIFEQNI